MGCGCIRRYGRRRRCWARKRRGADGLDRRGRPIGSSVSDTITPRGHAEIVPPRATGRVDVAPCPCLPCPIISVISKWQDASPSPSASDSTLHPVGGGVSDERPPYVDSLERAKRRRGRHRDAGYGRRRGQGCWCGCGRSWCGCIRRRDRREGWCVTRIRMKGITTRINRRIRSRRNPSIRRP